MNVYRFTTKTKCGKTDVIVQNADTLAEAKEKRSSIGTMS